MAGVERWRQCVGLDLLSSDLNQLARFARTLGLGYHVIRAYRLRRPDNDRRLAIVELLDNALTERFSRERAIRRFRWAILGPFIALLVSVMLPVLFLQLYFSLHQWTVYLGSWW